MLCGPRKKQRKEEMRRIRIWLNEVPPELREDHRGPRDIDDGIH